MDNSQLLEALAVAAELCGTRLSVPAARAFAHKLEVFPRDAVLLAIDRATEECRGSLTLADVISRIDDGRPNGDEAWGIIPKSEAETAVLTVEMRRAMSGLGFMIDDDPIAARMAFKAAYDREVREARAAKRDVCWSISLGWDQGGREGPILEALERGKISREAAVGAIGDSAGASIAIADLVGSGLKRIESAGA